MVYFPILTQVEQKLHEGWFWSSILHLIFIQSSYYNRGYFFYVKILSHSKTFPVYDVGRWEVLVWNGYGHGKVSFLVIKMARTYGHTKVNMSADFMEQKCMIEMGRSNRKSIKFFICGGYSSQRASCAVLQLATRTW